jgi:hypothetical protein
LTARATAHTIKNNFPEFLEMETDVRARFLGKDPCSQEGQSPTLFATDRSDRRTFIAQGWVVTDPEALADVGPVPAGETIIEIPEDVLRLYTLEFAEERR